MGLYSLGRFRPRNVETFRHYQVRYHSVITIPRPSLRRDVTTIVKRRRNTSGRTARHIISRNKKVRQVHDPECFHLLRSRSNNEQRWIRAGRVTSIAANRRYRMTFAACCGPRSSREERVSDIDVSNNASPKCFSLDPCPPSSR